jgi:hypothetical protein
VPARTGKTRPGGGGGAEIGLRLRVRREAPTYTRARKVIFLHMPRVIGPRSTYPLYGETQGVAPGVRELWARARKLRLIVSPCCETRRCARVAAPCCRGRQVSTFATRASILMEVRKAW